MQHFQMEGLEGAQDAQDAHLRELFRECDADDSGFIDADEMVILLGKLGVAPDQVSLGFLKIFKHFVCVLSSLLDLRQSNSEFIVLINFNYAEGIE